MVLTNITGPLVVTHVIRQDVCAGNDDIFYARLMSTAIFMSGVATIMQVTFGVRSVTFSHCIVSKIQWILEKNLWETTLYHVSDGIIYCDMGLLIHMYRISGRFLHAAAHIYWLDALYRAITHSSVVWFTQNKKHWMPIAWVMAGWNARSQQIVCAS